MKSCSQAEAGKRKRRGKCICTESSLGESRIRYLLTCRVTRTNPQLPCILPSHCVPVGHSGTFYDFLGLNRMKTGAPVQWYSIDPHSNKSAIRCFFRALATLIYSYSLSLICSKRRQLNRRGSRSQWSLSCVLFLSSGLRAVGMLRSLLRVQKGRVGWIKTAAEEATWCWEEKIPRRKSIRVRKSQSQCRKQFMEDNADIITARSKGKLLGKFSAVHSFAPFLPPVFHFPLHTVEWCKRSHQWDQKWETSYLTN